VVSQDAQIKLKVIPVLRALVRTAIPGGKQVN
jgi:hypothetical protein